MSSVLLSFFFSTVCMNGWMNVLHALGGYEKVLIASAEPELIGMNVCTHQVSA